MNDVIQETHTLGTRVASTAEEHALSIDAGDPVQAPPVLTMPEYRHLLHGLPLPTPQQIADFAIYVAGAHSWYKHLPPWPPGVRFQIFLDRHAGWDHTLTPQGGGILQPRLEQGFHHNMLPTALYRERFGCLRFSTGIPLVVGRLPANPAFDNTPYSEADLRRIPPEVIESGACELTAAVHKRSDVPGLSYSERSYAKFGRSKTDACWPEASGGLDTVQRIIARSELDRNAISHDPTLAALLAPERERQLEAMRNAAHRVCALS